LAPHRGSRRLVGRRDLNAKSALAAIIEFNLGVIWSVVSKAPEQTPLSPESTDASRVERPGLPPQ